jgi:hypothetical protein
VPCPERHATLPTHVPTCLAANPTTTMRGAVKGGPQGRPAGTAAKRRPLTAPVISDPTIDVAPTAQVGAWKTTTAPRSEAHLTLFLLAASGQDRDRHRARSHGRRHSGAPR